CGAPRRRRPCLDPPRRRRLRARRDAAERYRPRRLRPNRDGRRPCASGGGRVPHAGWLRRADRAEGLRSLSCVMVLGPWSLVLGRESGRSMLVFDQAIRTKDKDSAAPDNLSGLVAACGAALRYWHSGGIDVPVSEDLICVRPSLREVLPSLTSFA